MFILMLTLVLNPSALVQLLLETLCLQTKLLKIHTEKLKSVKLKVLIHFIGLQLIQRHSSKTGAILSVAKVLLAGKNEVFFLNWP